MEVESEATRTSKSRGVLRRHSEIEGATLKCSSKLVFQQLWTELQLLLMSQSTIYTGKGHLVDPNSISFNNLEESRPEDISIFLNT